MTTDPLILLFLVLHIITAGIWVSQFIAETALERFGASVKGKPGEIAATLARGRAAQWMGAIGGQGVLITGLLLTLGFHYGILGIGGVYTPSWLVWMQLIYVVAFLLFLVVVGPGARRVMPLFGKALATGEAVPADAQAGLDRVYLAGRVINILVLINIFVGVVGVNAGLR